MPKHNLELKKGAMVMLLRTLDVEAGLSNGTKLIVEEMYEYGVLCSLVNPSPNAEKRIFISPHKFKHVDKCGPTVSFIRIQLPLRLCYAMTIKKAQGQTLDKCGLLLNSHVFSHGQLYVALNKVRKGEDLSICCEAQLGMAQMRNVVCSKLFPNPALAQ